MEAEGVLDICKRSVANYNIRYNPFIGDDDSSSCSAVDKEEPYETMAFVQNPEYVNHATKIMGTNLRNLLREYKRLLKNVFLPHKTFHSFQCDADFSLQF